MNLERRISSTVAHFAARKGGKKSATAAQACNSDKAFGRKNLTLV
jgi:hypothetical protein